MENSKLRTHRVNMRMYRRAFPKGCAAVPAHPWRWWFRYSWWGYDEVFFGDASEEDVKDLGVMVSDAIEAWVRKHKIDVSACIFGGVRNEIKFEDISDTPERLDT
jgi:hypothetical protein